jgi:GcrA cell cycle regulator
MSLHETIVATRSNQHESTWTNGQIDRLRVLWADGISCRKIAATLNEEFNAAYSKNAIIGKARREGFPASNNRVTGRPQGSKDKHPRVYEPALPDLTDFSIPFAQRRTLFELRPQDCRWPVGDPCDPGFFFCGGKSLDTSPYCAGHSKRAYGYVKSDKSFGAFRY